MTPSPGMLEGGGLNLLLGAESTPRKMKTPLPKVGGCRRSPKFRNKATPVRKTPPPSPTVTKEVEEGDGDGDETQGKKKGTQSFQEHKDLCDRMAKNFYFGKLPSTPRPSLPLSKLAVSAFSRKARKDTLDILDLEQAAEIGRSACVTPTALIMALVYLERLSNHPTYLGTVKPSELFVVSLLVASKFMQDDGEDLGIFNDEWATSAHLELKKLNKLELQFLSAIDWRINVTPHEYSTALTWLEQEVSLGEGKRRGWFTYTEIYTVLPSQLFAELYQHCARVIAAACMTYAALIATVLTTAIIGPQVFKFSQQWMQQEPCLGQVDYATCSNKSSGLTKMTNRTLLASRNDLTLDDVMPLDKAEELFDLDYEMTDSPNFGNLNGTKRTDLRLKQAMEKASRETSWNKFDNEELTTLVFRRQLEQFLNGMAPESDSNERCNRYRIGGDFLPSTCLQLPSFPTSTKFEKRHMKGPRFHHNGFSLPLLKPMIPV